MGKEEEAEKAEKVEFGRREGKGPQKSWRNLIFKVKNRVRRRVIWKYNLYANILRPKTLFLYVLSLPAYFFASFCFLFCSLTSEPMIWLLLVNTEQQQLARNALKQQQQSQERRKRETEENMKIRQIKNDASFDACKRDRMKTRNEMGKRLHEPTAECCRCCCHRLDF